MPVNGLPLRRRFRGETIIRAGGCAANCRRKERQPETCDGVRDEFGLLGAGDSERWQSGKGRPAPRCLRVAWNWKF